MRNYFRKKIIIFCLIIVGLIIFLHPNMNAHGSYDYIETEHILNNLYAKVSENFSRKPLVKNCDYDDVLFDETVMSISMMVQGDLTDGHQIKEGGEFGPSDCNPMFSSAIIVPYRDKPEQLRTFLVYLHNFLQQQNIHYQIYVIEQVDSNEFNRAKLLNIGASIALKAGYPCLILHNLNLFPLRPANIYACTKCPRHMSSSINSFRYALSSLNIFGGAVAINAQQYTLINGMSNKYYGGGGEDDDFYARLKVGELNICRFSPQTSQYHKAFRKKQHESKLRKKLMSYTKSKMYSDGLNSLQYTKVATVLHPLFTHVMVDL